MMSHISVELAKVLLIEPLFTASPRLQSVRSPFALHNDRAYAVKQGCISIHERQKVMAKTHTSIDIPVNLIALNGELVLFQAKEVSDKVLKDEAH